MPVLDTLVEVDETFLVNLANPTNATIALGQGRRSGERRRYLAGIGEATEVPRRSPGRGPP